MGRSQSEATRALVAHSAGEPRAAAELAPLIYDDLRALARRYMQLERGSTLQPTALVHEAYMRLIDIDRIDWSGKTHFFAMAAIQMRRILVERARAASAHKRGGRPERVTLRDGLASPAEIPLDLLALDQALDVLARCSPRQCRVTELRLFGGLTVSETAHVLGVSERTVKQDWRVARAWLSTELSRGRGDAS
jgi:RNA polymerase sigma factor (TIGR02999 family)